jgi:RNA-directed DNA polymerase
VGFQYLAQAHRFLAELKQRLEAFALEVHPEKTRMIEFGRFAHENRRPRGQGKPETFAFLGLTHIFGRSREGRRLIRRHTIRERLNAKLRQVKANLYRMRHLPIPEQGALPAAGAERLLQLLRRPDQLPCPQRLLLPPSICVRRTFEG